MDGVTQQDPSTTTADLTRLAGESAAAGDFVNAHRYGRVLLEELRTRLGDDHPDTLVMAGTLANWQYHGGDVAGSFDTYGSLVHHFDAALGADHPATVQARHMLALRPHPDPAAGLVVWLRLFADEQRVLGPEHPTTLLSRANVAQFRWEMGDLVGAIAEGEQVLAARSRVLGDGDAETLGARLTLAVWRGEVSGDRSPPDELREVAAELGATLGADHVHTLTARHALAVWQDAAGDGADWMALAADEARVLGADHPMTVAAREHLAGG
jgi:hypothetical protein